MSRVHPNRNPVFKRVDNICLYPRIRLHEDNQIRNGVPWRGWLSFAVPATEPRDAAHIASAVTNGIDFLASWNFKCINCREIELIGRNCGFEPPVILYPKQLLKTPVFRFKQVDNGTPYNMGNHMKTTIDIADALLIRAKAKAQREKTTLKAIVEEALARTLEEVEPRAEIVPVCVSGNGLSPEFQSASFSNLLALIYNDRS